MKNLTAIILTYNEEENLKYCLESVSGLADEILIVDSYSTDKTVEIAKKFGAEVFEHPFENQAKQFNWALENLEIKGDWILRLDADEYLTKELKAEIAEKLNAVSEEISGFYIKRRAYFMGRWIKHGGYYPTWILRLFRKGKAKSEERAMDEHIVLSEGKSAKLKNDFIDEMRKSLEWWTAKHNNYSTREAEERIKIAEGKSGFLKSGLEGQAKRKRALKNNFYLKLPLFCRSLFYFIYRYFFRLGFLDGKEGLIFHFLQGFWHQFLIDAKICEKRKNKR
jgi:glycosyltransferase involved in cell wall biosynthesis